MQIESARRAEGGNSYETWFLQISEGPSTGTAVSVVLRREPVSGPIEPYDISSEARILSVLSNTTVPAPALLGHCSDRSVAARPFVVLEHVEGDIPDYRNVTQFPLWQDDTSRQQMTTDFMQVLAAIHSVRTAGDQSRGSLSERTLKRLAEMLAAVDRRVAEGWPVVPLFYDAAKWLERKVPDADESELVLVHGDYRIGNLIWRDGQIVSVLDWEGAHLGHRLEDLGYACHNVMRDERPDLMAMLAPMDEFIRRYEAEAGVDVDRRQLHYWVIFALFYHLWTILMVLPAGIEGNAKPRVMLSHFKVSLCELHLAAQISAYERGHDVL